MLATYFKAPRTLATYRSGLAGPYLDDFIAWLESRGYRRRTIRRHIREVVHLAAWAQSEGLTGRELDRMALARLHRDLVERTALRYPSGHHKHVYQSARVFVSFLETVGMVDHCAPHASTQPPALFLEFAEWMRALRGTRDSTLNNYRLPITDLLQNLVRSTH